MVYVLLKSYVSMVASRQARLVKTVVLMETRDATCDLTRWLSFVGQTERPIPLRLRSAVRLIRLFFCSCTDLPELGCALTLPQSSQDPSSSLDFGSETKSWMSLDVLPGSVGPRSRWVEAVHSPASRCLFQLHNHCKGKDWCKDELGHPL